jgi:hypothetical protein
LLSLQYALLLHPAETSSLVQFPAYKWTAWSVVGNGQTLVSLNKRGPITYWHETPYINPFLNGCKGSSRKMWGSSSLLTWLLWYGKRLSSVK